MGGRRFGVVLIWLLMAGEIYTTFTFLGASGWAYSKGAPTFYILIYGTLAYTVSFFILPALWKSGKRHGLHTQPDFFVTQLREPRPRRVRGRHRRRVHHALSPAPAHRAGFHRRGRRATARSAPTWPSCWPSS